MILTFDQIRFDPVWGESIFKGGVMDSPGSTWESRMPQDIPQLVGDAQADPASVVAGAVNPDKLYQFQEGILSVDDLLWDGLANTNAFDIVSSTRQLVGTLVQQTGMLARTFRTIRSIFSEPTERALKIINLVSGLVESSLFQRALDMIGLIPVVGWIIKIVVDVAKLLTRVVTRFFDENEKTARAMVANQLSIPLTGTEFSKEADQLAVRNVYNLIRTGQSQRLIQPAYEGEFAAGGVFDDGSTGRPTGSEENSARAVGWVVFPGEATGGYGFVPGTGNLSRSLFFGAGVTGSKGDNRGPNGNGPRDLGGLYPTAQGLLNSWWQIVLTEGPALFSVDPLVEVDAWENYIWNLLVFSQNQRQGWTEMPTGVKFTDKFWCVSDLFDLGNCDEPAAKGQKLTIPGEFGRDQHVVLMTYLYNVFFGLKKLSKWDAYFNPEKGTGLPLISDDPKTYPTHLGGRLPEPDQLDLSQSVPSVALENLFDRQVAALQSINCLYVDGEQENRDRFPAFNNKALRDRWYESVTALFQSQDWRRVVFADVPESRMKEQLRQLAKNNGIDPESLNPPCPPDAPMSDPRCTPSQFAPGPTILGDPTLPDPPEPNDSELPSDPGSPKRQALTPERAKLHKSKKKGGGGGIAIVAIALGAALFASRR